jgi:hypothetical protein
VSSSPPHPEVLEALILLSVPDESGKLEEEKEGEENAARLLPIPLLDPQSADDGWRLAATAE